MKKLKDGDTDIMESNSTEIRKLNDDCLLHIFEYLSIFDKLRIERVCQKWQALLLHLWRRFKKFDLSRSTWGLPETDKFTYIDSQVLGEVLKRCGRYVMDLDICKALNEDGSTRRKDQTKLHIIGETSNILKIVGETCPDLKAISISDPCIDLVGLQSVIDKCQNITTFCLVSRKWILPENDLGTLFCSMHKLRYLTLSCNNISGECLLQLPEEMEEIHLVRMFDASSQCVANAINKFHKLHALTIDANPDLEADLLQAIVHRTESLRSLRLSGYVRIGRLTKHGIREFAKFTNVKILDFRHNFYISNEVLEIIGTTCKNLTDINISCCGEITDKGIMHLAGITDLEHLKANRMARVTGKNFGIFRRLKKLECRGSPRLKEGGLCNLIQVASALELLDVSWNKSITCNLLNVAIDSVMARTNNIILKLYTGNTKVDSSSTMTVPLLRVINSSSEEFYREGLGF